MNKLHILVKILKKEVIVESLEENSQVQSSSQKLEEPIGGEQRNIDEDNQIEISEDVEPVAEQHEEDDEAIFKKLNIPWLSEETLSFQEGKMYRFRE